MQDTITDRNAEMTLFMFPGACSQVTMNALETAGLDYEEHVVNIFAGEQKSEAYVSVNPKRKVPALRIGDRTMTENAAIIWFLHQQHPQATLLPRPGSAPENAADSPIADNQSLIDLVWCSGTLHPMVRQVRMPSRYTKADPSGVREDGTEKFTYECRLLAERLSGGRWWYGAEWSIVDDYLCWLYGTAAKGGFPLPDYPALTDHAARLATRSAARRVREREEAAVARLGGDLPADFRL